MSNGKDSAFKRAYKACLSCRKRKVRCVFDEGEPISHGCLRCRREARECVVPTSTKRGGIQNVISGRERRRRETEAREQLAQAAAIKSEGWQTRELYNTTDALSILSHVARSFPKIEGRHSDSLPDVTPSYDSNGRSAPKDNFNLPQLDFIAQDRILTSSDAAIFVNFFFERIGPIYPGIPFEYRSVDTLNKLPMLFGTVCMIASRYYVAYGQDNSIRERSFEIHLRMWIWVRRSLAQHIWSSQISQSLDTVLTNLLLSEWGPVAFELRPEEIARYLAFRGTPSEEWVRKTTLRNSDRTLLLIIGNAVRLAQDAGFDHSETTVNVGLLLSEVVISSRMGRPCMLANIIREPLNMKLNYTIVQQAQAEILQIMAMANDMLYHSREHTRDLLASGRYLSLLFMFVPHFENWMDKYSNLFEGDAKLDVKAILFGAYHIKLYTFSLALSRRGARAEDTPIMSRASSVEPPQETPDRVDPSSSRMSSAGYTPGPARPLTWDRQGTQFINIAVDSAKKLIGIASEFFQKGQLAFMPTRWAMYIIHAIVVLIKTLIVMPPLKTRDRASETLALTRQAAQMLVNSGPDNYHVCRLYGTVLVNLCAHLVKDISRSQDTSRASTPGSSLVKPLQTENPSGAVSDSGCAESDAGSSSSAPQAALTPFSPHEYKFSPDGSQTPQKARVMHNGEQATQAPTGPVHQAADTHNAFPQPGTVPHGIPHEQQQQMQPLQQQAGPQPGPPSMRGPHQPQPPNNQHPNPLASSPHVSERPATAMPMGLPNGGHPDAALHPQHPAYQQMPRQAQEHEFGFPPDMRYVPNVDFDFMMSGGDGLGFVEPFLETLSKSDLFENY